MDYTHWLQSGPSGLRSPADLFGGTKGSSADCISNPEVGGDTREGFLWLDYLEFRRPNPVTYTPKGRSDTTSAVRRSSVELPVGRSATRRVARISSPQQP